MAPHHGSSCVQGGACSIGGGRPLCCFLLNVSNINAFVVKLFSLCQSAGMQSGAKRHPVEGCCSNLEKRALSWGTGTRALTQSPCQTF